MVAFSPPDAATAKYRWDSYATSWLASSLGEKNPIIA